MLNIQVVEKVNYHPDGNVDVIDIWDTIQGEGPYAGMPAVFIRLAGCNLQCKLCDTDYTSDRVVMKPEDVVRSAMDYRRELVVITGGEPFRQNIVPLLDQLRKSGFRFIQIETNGTLPPPPATLMSMNVMVVCSPKTPNVNKRMYNRVNSWKYIVEDGKISTEDGLPTSSLGEPKPPARPPKHIRKDKIYVQPLDVQDTSQNKIHMEAAVEVCMRYGYRLCLQQHKIVGLP